MIDDYIDHFMDMSETEAGIFYFAAIITLQLHMDDRATLYL